MESLTLIDTTRKNAAFQGRGFRQLPRKRVGGYSMRKQKTGKGLAFLEGGFGCLCAALVLGLFSVVVGGTLHFDVSGLILLFIIGGVMGLIAVSIYNKSRRRR
jgi:hypothetical protein